MKIVCDNCATKYSIADEKVRGKVFKIRCKKCSHIIVVRGGEGAAAAAPDGGREKADESFPGDDPATVLQPRSATGAQPVVGTGEAVWHLVIDREQIGPLTVEEVKQKFAAREIDIETYAWREGFADWLRLGSIEDFKDLGESQVPGPSIHEGATRRTDTADLFATAGATSRAEEAPAAADLFGGQNVPGGPTNETPMPQNDLFGGGGQALFSAPQGASPAAPASRARTASPGFGIQASAPAAEPAGPPPADANKLTGQRSESSVLFSLNNLQALASGGGATSPAPKPQESRPGFANSQSEGSGLIDIRAMAASTLASGPTSPSSKNDEPPSFAAAPLFSPMAAPILMPSAASGPPKWIWALLGIGVLAVLGIIGIGVLFLTTKPAIAPVALNTAPPPAAAVPGAPAVNPAAPAANPAAPAAAAPAAAAPAADTKADDDKSKKRPATKTTKSKESGSTAAPAAAAPSAPAPAAKPKSGGKRDELDDLLNTAAPDKPAAKHSAPKEEAPAAGGKEQLDKSDIVGGMGRIKGRVQGCYDQYKVPGLANVSVTIGRNGRVSSANVSGSFSGTPTGNCVESAVKSASFPAFSGSPQTINYPFMLR